MCDITIRVNILPAEKNVHDPIIECADEIFSIDMSRSEIGSRIHNRRNAINISRAYLAEKIGAPSEAWVEIWEDGDVSPESCFITALSKALGCDVTWLLVGEERKSTHQSVTLYAPSGDSGISLSDRIQLSRENLGLSEADLARQLGTYSDHISDWECGITEPPASMVIPLANALKCDPLWLLGDSESNAPVKVMQNVDVSTIGKRIGVARVENHMNTQELEEMIGAPDGTVFRWETGKAIPSSQYIDNLAKALNTSVTWLLTGKVTHQDLSGVGKQQHLPASQRADVLSHEAPQR